MDSPSLTILIPCLNEELGVASAVREYLAAFPNADILVVDNGSEDGTAAAARAAGAVVMTEKRRGKARAVATALAVIDTDSGFVTVLSKRADVAGWQLRLASGAVPPQELVAMKLNALLLDPALLGDEGWSYLERVCGMLPDLGVIVCTGRSTVAQRVRGLRLGVDDTPVTRCGPRIARSFRWGSVVMP